MRPTKVTSGKIYANYDQLTGEERYSGTFTITLSAYDPYGYLKYQSYNIFDTEGASQYCGMLENTLMPAAPTVSSQSFLMYNPGTQTCSTIFRISGTAATGLTITNETNGTKCEIVSLPSAGYLEIDSYFGSVAWVHGTEEELAFARHGEGFITLAPYMTDKERAAVSYTADSANVTFINDVPPMSLIGKYMYVDGAWRKITAINNRTATLSAAVTNTGAADVPIVTMNEITIAGTDIALTRLEAVSRPIIV